MRILITGGAGFIGSHIAESLVTQGHDVVIYDNFSTGSRANLAGVATACQVIEGDIRDLDSLVKAVRGVDIQFIKLNPRFSAGGPMLTVEARGKISFLALKLAQGYGLPLIKTTIEITTIRYWKKFFIH